MRLLRSPVAAVWLGLACLLDACSLPRGTVVGSALSGLGHQRYCHGWISAEVHRTEDGLVLVPRGGAAPDDSASMIFVSYRRPREVYEGLWAPTSGRVYHRLLIADATEAEEPLVRALYADHLLTAEGGRLSDEAPLIRMGDSTTTRALASGYVHNAIVAVVFGALMVSLGSIRSWPAMVKARERRDLMALEAGLCPRCRYDIAGLARRKCPECGTEW